MAIIFNISEALAQSRFNILQEPIKMLLENEKELYEKGSMLDKIYLMRSTDKYQEEFRSATSMDGFKPTEDLQPAGLSDFAEGYRQTFNNQIWTNAFAVSKQTIEDNEGININPQAMGFIKSYGRTREQFGFAMLSGALLGTATFGGKVFTCKGMDTTDGTVEGAKQVYFHKAHLPLAGVAGGVSQSNFFYKSLTLTDATAAEQLANIVGQVESKMKEYRDYKGNILDIQPTRILLPTHYLFKKAMHVALQTPMTSEMGTNGINIQYGSWEIIETPYLNDLYGFAAVDQAFVMISPETNRQNMGAVWNDRVELEVTSRIDPDSKANIWDGRARFGVGFADFRAMAYVATGPNATAAIKAAAETLA